MNAVRLSSIPVGKMFLYGGKPYVKCTGNPDYKDEMYIVIDLIEGKRVSLPRNAQVKSGIFTIFADGTYYHCY